MNAARRGSNNVKLFFPDPWVYSEKAYPKELNKILEPIKKTIKNRGNDSIFKKIFSIISIISILIKSVTCPKINRSKVFPKPPEIKKEYATNVKRS